MSVPLTLRWSIHSRDALHALERLIAWLDPHGPIHRRLWPLLKEKPKPEPIENVDG